ncbi:MAG: heavy-metal-associated domain-containing protein [Bacteroidales bacterium]|nr:heavy-metal-associated domain-containing protein [Bacteroidales bacterium]
MFFAVLVQAQNVKEVVFTTEPEIECNNCVNKIKNNLRFEKGVKAINPDLKTKLVTIQYDSEKTDVDNLIKAFAKIKYKATVVEPKKEVEKEEKTKKE